MPNGDMVVENLRKEYQGVGAVLNGVNFRTSAGEGVAILGPSGSGKSTLLNVIGSLDTPTSGTVRLGDVEIPRLRGAALAEFRSRRVGFVFQDHHLLPQCTAMENVALPALANADMRGGSGEKALALLERVGLAERATAFPATMSGGERQRVALARALINNPTLLLCDEPTGNLDSSTASDVMDLLLDVASDAGNMLIVVTHNQAMARRLERRLELSDGVLRE